MWRSEKETLCSFIGCGRRKKGNFVLSTSISRSFWHFCLACYSTPLPGVAPFSWAGSPSPSILCMVPLALATPYHITLFPFLYSVDCHLESSYFCSLLCLYLLLEVQLHSEQRPHLAHVILSPTMVPRKQEGHNEYLVSEVVISHVVTQLSLNSYYKIGL